MRLFRSPSEQDETPERVGVHLNGRPEPSELLAMPDVSCGSSTFLLQLFFIFLPQREGEEETPPIGRSCHLVFISTSEGGTRYRRAVSSRTAGIQLLTLLPASKQIVLHHAACVSLAARSNNHYGSVCFFFTFLTATVDSDDDDDDDDDAHFPPFPTPAVPAAANAAGPGQSLAKSSTHAHDIDESWVCMEEGGGGFIVTPMILYSTN